MSNFSHGMSKTRVYNIWSCLKKRCLNPNDPAYPNYGGRGITIHDSWMSFETFLHDMGEPSEGMSIERINNDLGYIPGNCKWATRKEQSRNKRGLHIITANGQSKCIGEWSEITGIPLKTICARIYKGWSEEDAVLIPLVSRRKGIGRGLKLRHYQ